MNSFHMKRAVRAMQINLDQNAVTHCLVNEHKDGDGRWPTVFHLKEYTFIGEKNRYWFTRLYVQEVGKRIMISDMRSNSQQNNYVLGIVLNWCNILEISL